MRAHGGWVGGRRKAVWGQKACRGRLRPCTEGVLRRVSKTHCLYSMPVRSMKYFVQQYLAEDNQQRFVMGYGVQRGDVRKGDTFRFSNGFLATS